MYMPIVFEGPEKDYQNLLNGVQLWDVGVERQVEIKGPDAAKLAQYITPRDINKCKVGQALYAPLLDFEGGFINDPVMLKLAEDHFWFSFLIVMLYCGFRVSPQAKTMIQRSQNQTFLPSRFKDQTQQSS